MIRSLSVVVFLVLAACAEREAISNEEILARAAALPDPEPGLYRTTSTLVSFEMDQPDAADAAWARENMVVGTSQTSETCLTSEEAARGFAPMVEAMAGSGCEVTRFDVQGDRMGADIACENSDGTRSEVTMLATAGATESRLENLVIQSGAGIRGGRIEMGTLTVNERIGECNAPSFDTDQDSQADQPL